MLRVAVAGVFTGLVRGAGASNGVRHLVGTYVVLLRLGAWGGEGAPCARKRGQPPVW